MSLLQSFDIQPSNHQAQPFVHFKGKPHGSGFNVNPTRLLTLNFSRPSRHLPGSDVEAALQAMALGERRFVNVDSIAQLPVNISINKSPRAPLSWSATYLFPSGGVEDYLANVFEESEEPFLRDSSGVLSWTLRGSVDYEPYILPSNNSQQVQGYIYADLSISIDATLDFAISNPNSPESVLLQGLILDINPHTLKTTVTSSEDLNFRQTWKYTWDFGIL